MFPAIAADRADNLYIVFSDGSNSYYTSSTDGGASWRLTTIVQSGFGLKSTVEPWVVAGDAGRIAMTDASWRLLASSSGVTRLPGLALQSAASSSTQGSLVTSGGKNVHLDSGTQMLLRVVSQ